MIEIATDRRRIEAEPDESAHESAVVLGRRFVVLRLDLARELLRIETTRTFVAHDCVSIEEYGARYVGISARDARELVDLGRALDVAPAPQTARAMGVVPSGGGEAVATEQGTVTEAAEASMTVADAVRAGALSVERAAAVGRMIKTPGLVHDGEDPVALAMAGSMHQVRTTIRVREEEIAQDVAVVPVGLAVTVSARDGFRRARSVASERAGTMLTEGETFSVVVEHYLETFDPSRLGEGTRRAIDTSETPGQRYIPAAVRRAVRERSGERCEVPGCPHGTFLEFAHVEPHRVGGSREEGNLVRVCGGHHVLLDAGRVRVASMAGGHPAFCDARGGPLGDRTARSSCDGLGGGTSSDVGPDNAVSEDAVFENAVFENARNSRDAQPAKDNVPSGRATRRADPDRHAGARGDAAYRDLSDFGDSGSDQVAERAPPYERGEVAPRALPTWGLAPRSTSIPRSHTRQRLEAMTHAPRRGRCRPPPAISRSRTSPPARAGDRCPS
ncbi:MAG: HNH endonuclease [Planctomycetes bacterium]|nr:HNH endonuclease [Planctomycetota bacterium]